MYWLTHFSGHLSSHEDQHLSGMDCSPLEYWDRSQCRSHPVLAAAPIKRCTDRLYKAQDAVVEFISSASLHFQYSTKLHQHSLSDQFSRLRFFCLRCCCRGFSSCADCRMDQTKESAQSAQNKMGDTMQAGHNKASVIARGFTFPRSSFWRSNDDGWAHEFGCINKLVQ